MKNLLAIIGLLLLTVLVIFGICWTGKQYISDIKQRDEEVQVIEAVTTEEVTEEVIEAMAEVDYTMNNAEEMIDEAFGMWLYEHYPDAFGQISTLVTEQNYSRRLWHDATGKSLFVLRDEYQGLLDSEEIMRENLIYTKNCGQEDYVSLSFAGDVSFANDYLPAQNYTNAGIDGAFSKDVQELMRGADIMMLNNEFCYTNGGVAQTAKGYCFRADPARVARLDEMGVDIVSIANNHAYDYGETGFLDTIDTLDNSNMPYVGGGKNLDDAKNHIVYFIANGIKIGYIAGTQIERDGLFTMPATENSAGVVRCYEADLVNEMIQTAKSQCDFVIVYPHWGTEKMERFEADQQGLAHSFIDAGADVVIGGHPHRLQGVEYYNNTPVFYSLSNFSFSSMVIDSTIVNLQVNIDGLVSAQFIPCMENGGQTVRCETAGDSYVRIINHLNDISSNASIDSDGFVTEKNE